MFCFGCLQFFVQIFFLEDIDIMYYDLVIDLFFLLDCEYFDSKNNNNKLQQ